MNEPPRWQEDAGVLRVTTGERGDFWSRTFYGYVRATGHFRHTAVTGDFTASVEVEARYETLYDQAGLMVWADEDNWLKAGIEFTDGAMHVSTVVTRGGWSDWSQQPLAAAANASIGVRLTRHGEALRVHCRLPGGHWRMIRLAMLDMGDSVEAGMMCCTPERAGLDVTFRDFRVGPPIARVLHKDDDTAQASHAP